MDLSEYVLIEGAARDRLGDLLQAAAPRQVKAPTPTLATMLYVASTLRARPRDIDRYIDYFGDRVLHRR